MPPIGITVGNKNVGKSSFSKYLLNRLLNIYPKIAYLETDIGQSEFTPEGILSLNILESPILGPSFTHVQQPYCSYFIGDNNSKDNPDYYLECIRQLIKVYRRDFACRTDHGMNNNDDVRMMLDDDLDDDDDDDDDDDEMVISGVPLIINTHGWIKGMGLDICYEIIKSSKPTHIFQFHSIDQETHNIPTFPIELISSLKTTNKSEALKTIKLEPFDSSTISNKRYTPSDYRILNMLFYFHRNNDKKDDNDEWWQFRKPLVKRLPWCLNWKKCLTKGIILTSEEVPYSQLLYALNGTLVALIGDNIDNISDYHYLQDDVVDDEVIGTDYSTTTAMMIENREHEHKKKIVPPKYNPKRLAPPSPTEHQCLGLAIIRSIDPINHTFHILTPLPPAILFKTNAIIKGALELPVWFMLDNDDDNYSRSPSKRVTVSFGICGIPWNKLPYMNVETGEGIGRTARSNRRYLKRRQYSQK